MTNDLQHATVATEPAAATMQAIVQERYGPAEELRVGSVARPEPEADEVLVRVHAAGIDRGTWHLMAGRPYLVRLAFGLRRPKNPVPGLDLAGTVESVGSSVSRFRPGDEVFGIGRGSLAPYAVAKEAKLAAKPQGLTFEQAAVLPVSGLTAMQGLLDVGRLRSGQRVLITGASGGVGTYAVQIAKAHGAEVTGVCSAAKADLVRSLGADLVLDYARDDFADGTRTYDLILDIGGNSSLRRLRRALTATGTLVIVGGEGGDRFTGGLHRQLRALLLSPFVRQRLTTFVSKERHEDLDRLRELVDGARVAPVIDSVHPLDQAAEAMRLLEAGRVRGKLAITMPANAMPTNAMPTNAMPTNAVSPSADPPS